MEKGFFGIFNDKLFMIHEPMDISCVVKDTGNQVRERIEGSTFIPEIFISNVEENVSTNGEMCYSTLAKIEKEKITELPVLHNRYRMLVDYQLYDEHEHRIIDEGIITKPIEAINAMIPLGLDTETDELVYRVVKKISSRIVLMYKEEVPYGIMKERRSSLSLRINRIEIQQVVDYSKDIELLPIKHPYDHHNKCHNSHLHYHHYPNRKPYDENPIKFREEFFTIYDSRAEGLDFSVINITMYPKKIIFDMQVLLNNYFFISDAHNIFSLIADNYNEKFPPVEGIVPDDKDPDDNKGDNDGDTPGSDKPPVTDKDDTEKTMVEVDKFWVEYDKPINN